MERPGSRTQRSLTALLVALALFAAAAGGAWLAWREVRQDREAQGRRLSNVLFRRVLFERFVVAGNSGSGTDGELTRRLLCLHLRGEASISFDLRRLRRETRGGRQVAVYAYPEARDLGLDGVLPFLVEVRVAPDDVREALAVEPRALDAADVNAPARAVGVVAGLAGAYVGARTGAGVGTTVFGLPGRLAGAGLGALAGGGAAGAGGFVLTRKLLCGLRLGGPLTQRHKDEILEQARILIAAELLFDSELAAELTEAFRGYARALYAQLGLPVDEVVLDEGPAAQTGEGG